MGKSSGISPFMHCNVCKCYCQYLSNLTDLLINTFVANIQILFLQFFSFQVGLGNVWRFPYTAYENGGGAFLIPYLVVLIMIGRPLYFMELSMGQFSSSSNVKVWNMVPAARGVGFAQVIGTASVVSYYCVLIALSIYYLVVSCQSTLPWTVCWDELKVQSSCKKQYKKPFLGRQCAMSSRRISWKWYKLF